MKRPAAWLLLTAFLSAGCLGLRGTRATPVVHGDVLAFDLRYGNANGLLGASLARHGATNTLWQRSYNYFRGKSLEYGALSSELRDEPLVLRLTWQYDEFLAACAGSETYEFIITGDGKVLGLKKER